MFKKYVLLMVGLLTFVPAAQAGLGQRAKAALVWQNERFSLYNRAGWDALAYPLATLGAVIFVGAAISEKTKEEAFFARSSAKRIMVIAVLGTCVSGFFAAGNTLYDVTQTIKTRWDKRKAAKQEALKKQAAEQPAPVEGDTTEPQQA